MKKMVVAAVLAAIGVAAGLAMAEEKAKEAAISVRKVEAQTVLYTIYRGPYEGVGKPIGELYALAGKNGIAPRGGPALVYLNNPALVSQEHLLTEIRIPVGEEAKKLAGTLGAMTDVKSVGPHEAAVIEKAGGDMDYAGIYARLYEWIGKNGYRSMDNASEVFKGGGRGGGSMSSEIMVPVAKPAAKGAGGAARQMPEK